MNWTQTTSRGPGFHNMPGPNAAKRLWRGRETSRRFNRICRADLNESGTEHQSRTLMSRIVQVSGNGFYLAPTGPASSGPYISLK
jgi:hypothetical protein